MKVTVLGIACTILFLNGITLSYAQKKLSALEAIKLAENFIVDNGYTDLPPSTDESEITDEPVERFSGAERLKIRHNSLEREAESFHATEKNWYVSFRRQKNHRFYRPNSCRILVMDLDGGNAHLLHPDYSCGDEQPRGGGQTVSFCGLVRQSLRYKGKEVRVRAAYHTWFEGWEFTKMDGHYCDGAGAVLVNFDEQFETRTDPETLKRLKDSTFRLGSYEGNGRFVGEFWDWQVELLVTGVIHKVKKDKGRLTKGSHLFVVTRVEEVGDLKKFDFLTLKYVEP